MYRCGDDDLTPYRNGDLFVWGGARSALPASLAPAERDGVRDDPRARDGSHEVRFDLVKDGVAWTAASR